MERTPLVFITCAFFTTAYLGMCFILEKNKRWGGGVGWVMQIEDSVFYAVHVDMNTNNSVKHTAAC